MADIELVIKIPEEIYKHILSMQFYIPGLRSGKSLLEKILKAIRTGTPLPKGHGELKDMSNIKYVFDLTREDPIYSGKDIESAIKSMKTIIEADKAEVEPQESEDKE